MPVVRGLVAVNRHPNPDAASGEKLAEFLIQQDAIGMNPQIQITDPGHGRRQFRRHPPQPGHARQQRLTAVQHHVHRGQPVRGRVLGDPPGGLGDDRVRHRLRAPPPALVRGLVDVAMITGKVTAAVHLQHELAQRDNQPAHPRPPVRF